MSSRRPRRLPRWQHPAAAQPPKQSLQTGLQGGRLLRPRRCCSWLPEVLSPVCPPRGCRCYILAPGVRQLCPFLAAASHV